MPTFSPWLSKPIKKPMKKQYRWKFLREVDGKIKSNSGDCIWTIGKQKKYTGSLDMCNSGFHCCQNTWQAFSYVQGEIVAKVEVSGKNIIEDDKEVWEKMKIVKAYRWTKKDSVELAIYSAELVIGNFEKVYPNDDRPRKAIEAAKNYIKTPTEENRQAAWAAAWAAGAAESAARAARAAAEAAAGAAWAAGAARAALIKKIAGWMDDRIKSLEEIK